jgi:hypothetical protein
MKISKALQPCFSDRMCSKQYGNKLDTVILDNFSLSQSLASNWWMTDEQLIGHYSKGSCSSLTVNLYRNLPGRNEKLEP